jgi:hypothetical protein
MALDTLDVLMKARAEVEQHWCKGRAHNWDGSVCALGAIEVAAGIPHEAYRTCISKEGSTHPAALLLRRHVPQAFEHNVPAFNDDEYTTQADVLAMFDRTITSTRARRRLPMPARRALSATSRTTTSTT